MERLSGEARAGFTREELEAAAQPTRKNVQITSGTRSMTDWEAWAATLEDYVRQSGKMPMAQRCVWQGRDLAKWLTRQRKAYKKGRLSPEQISRLEGMGMSWDPANDRWEEMFRFVLHVRELTGALPVGTAKVCFTADRRDVGQWLTRQRRLYAAGKQPEDRASRLLAEGIVREETAFGGRSYRIRVRYAERKRNPDHWDACYAAAKAWYEREGNLLIPSRYVTEDGLKLGSWISWLRTLYNNCPSAGRALYQDEIQQMEAIGMVWRIQRQPSWAEWLEQVELYVKEHGDLSVPYRYEQNGFKLSTWLQSQRVNYKAGLLSKARIESLERYGMVWSLDKRRDWDTYLALAKRYYEEHGDLLVPGDYYTEDGYALGPWISLQRERHKGNARYREAPAMTPEEIAALEGIGMVWENVHALRWERMYEAARDYYEQWGEVPAQGSRATAPDGRGIGAWIGQQRRQLRAGRLDAERAERLRAIGVTV